MLAALALWCALALAGPAEDVELAADSNKPDELRQEAFARLASAAHAPTLIRIASDSTESAPRRWVAVRALGASEAPEAREALIKLLSSEAAMTRIAACMALGERKDFSTSGNVAARLEDKALLVRQAAADGLAVMGDPSTLPDLERALKDPSNHYRGSSMWVRRHYVEAMGAIGTKAAAPYLASALTDGDPEVVNAAVKGLERIAGFSYAQGRTRADELEAWTRWARNN